MVVLDDDHRFFFLYLGQKKSPISLNDQAGGFSFRHKKALHFHVRLFVFRFIVTTSKSLNRSIVRSRRLYEQGVDENRLRQYVQRWFSWLHGGLRNRVSMTGGFNRIWQFVLKYLNITGYPAFPR